MGVTYVGTTFKGEKVLLNGNSFQKCHFSDCELIFNGMDTTELTDCTFERPQLIFDGPGATTIHFLHAMNNGGLRGLVHPTIVAISSPEPFPLKI